MNIHHATAKKAEKLGVRLEAKEIDGQFVAQATNVDGVRFASTDPKVALGFAALSHQFLADYPALAIEQDSIAEFVIIHTDEEKTKTSLLTLSQVPDLAEILDECHVQELDPEIGFEEDKPSVVVPDAYKRAYAERGNRDHCGDWLALAMEDAFIGGDMKFDADAFTVCLVENETDMTGKWANLPTSGQRGWKGRYRMNGRQKLELQLVRRGYITIDGKKLEPSRDYLERLLDKHPHIDVEWD